MNSKQSFSTELYSIFIMLLGVFYFLILPFFALEYKLFAGTIILVVSLNRMKKLYFYWDVAMEDLFFERYRVKNLYYYYIFDENRARDIEMRELHFEQMSMEIGRFFLFLLYTYYSLCIIISMIFPISRAQLEGILIFALVVFIFTISGNILLKYYRIFFTLIPFVALIVLVNLKEQWRIVFESETISISVYIIIVALLYIVSIWLVPLHIVRRVYGLTMIINSSLAILLPLGLILVQKLIVHFVDSEIRGAKTEDILAESTMSESAKTFLGSDSFFFEELMKYQKNEYVAEFFSFTSTILSLLSITILIGISLILIRIKMNQAKASRKYYSIIRDMNNQGCFPKYERIKRCCYLGGEEYELRLISDMQISKLVFSHEKNFLDDTYKGT
ncbi:hypothetical protein HB852_03230 [Listeria grandensis]|uniref:hypothetical protein n=1 Tax=Listeria grandensis TaxID=1494963 RepID=UPI001624EC09|nr:hypothetical protein [Listeria grandensis]MBC1473637.1 hypothetical protein [Listeria grandensis]